MTSVLVHPARLVAALGLAALVAVGCSSPPATTSPTATPGSVESAPPTTPPASSSVAVRVSANTATEQELAAAFSAAGIPNADRWAREVAEYRPYDADPTWAKLRQELAKYNIDPTVLEQILATLEL
jgi:hypothetical protein